MISAAKLFCEYINASVTQKIFPVADFLQANDQSHSAASDQASISTVLFQKPSGADEDNGS
jgi:hypothetical protein